MTEYIPLNESLAPTAVEVLPHQRYMALRDPATAEALAALVSEYRQLPYHSGTALSRAGACIELATKTSSTFIASKLLDEAQEQTTAISAHEQEYVEPRYIQAEMLGLVIPKYRRLLVERRALTVDSEQDVWQGALRIMSDERFATAAKREFNSNTQAALALIALNARYNVNCNQVVQHVWPSMPRHASPYSSDTQQRMGWNVGVAMPAEPLNVRKFMARHKGKITDADGAHKVRKEYQHDITVLDMSRLAYLPERSTVAAVLKTESRFAHITKPGAEASLEASEAHSLAHTALNLMTEDILEKMGWSVYEQEPTKFQGEEAEVALRH